MNAPDPGTKLDSIYDKNPLFTFHEAAAFPGSKSFRNDDGLIGRYIMLQSSSPLRFSEISLFKTQFKLGRRTFYVKKGVTTENLECPATHPYAFRGGAQCCVGYREQDDSTASESDWPSE